MIFETNEGEASVSGACEGGVAPRTGPSEAVWARTVTIEIAESVHTGALDIADLVLVHKA